ncbi:hypothetical protein SDC9_211200 [bioreactor metagenome]|uniref:Uncharacterized protein n=1 Tax=bioreactor metagenome TaxID=1076179 RepID=A0A645JIL3_9ZZZZ
MLHDAGNEHVLAVGQDVHLQLLAHEVLVDEDRQRPLMLEDHLHVALHVVRRIGDGHVLAAQHVGRTHHQRVTNLFRFFDSLFDSRHGGVGRLF